MFRCGSTFGQFEAFPIYSIFPFFLGIFAQLLLLYLMAAACVPRAADAASALDAESYEENRPYFWRVFSAYQFMYAGFWVFFATKQGLSAGDLVARIFMPSGGATPFVIGCLLVVTRNRFAQGAGLSLLVFWLLAAYWDYTIS